MLNQNPNAGDKLVFCFFFRCQRLALRLFLGLIDRDAKRLIALKPRILEEVDLQREHQLFDVTDALVVHATGIRFTQVAHQTFFDVNDEIVFERMLFFYRCTDSAAL